MQQNRRTFLKGTAGLGMAAGAMQVPGKGVRATGFESREVYHSRQRPGYACWVSFFPGERGHWYLTCEEVTRPAKPYPKMTDQRFTNSGFQRGTTSPSSRWRS